MIRRPPRSTPSSSSAASDIYKRQVYANVTARPATEPRRLLAEQLVAPVRFAETLEHMAEAGIEVFVHVGPGDVTAGLARRTVPGAEVLVCSRRADVPEVAARLSVR